MNTLITPYKILIVFLVLTTPAFADSHGGKVQIDWIQPEGYSDMHEGNLYSPSLFKRFSSAMESFIKEKTERYLPPDVTLGLTIKDVDLAGEAEPWRRPSASDIRIIKDIYPPRMKFEYKIADADGNVLKQGLAQITDLMFLWNMATPSRTGDPFYYEKELMAGWLRKNLENLPTGS